MTGRTLFREAPELVTNGNCELDSNWYGTPIETPPAITRSEEKVHSGTYSMKLASTGSNGIRSETFKVALGNTYRFSGWFYTASTTGSIHIYAYNGLSSAFTVIYPDITPNTWCSFSLNKTMEVGGSNCRIMVYIADSGNLYIDDISVREV